MSYLSIFLQSNLLEVPFYYLALRPRGSFAQVLVLATAINSLTHPIVFFLIMNLKLSYLQNILLAESFAILTEALFFWWLLKVTPLRSFMASLMANLASWQFAPILTYLLFRTN